MRDKILARFRAKFPAVNLSNKRLDAIADKLSAKITDENEIDAKLDELNDFMPFAEIAKQDDKVRDLEAKVKGQKTPTGKEPKEGSDTDPKDPPVDEPPAWAKDLITEVKTLRAEKLKTSMQEKVSSHEKLKGIPASYYKGRTLPDKEEDLETFVEGIAKDYNDFKQDLANEGLLSSSKPILGSTGKDGVSTEVEKYIESKTAAQEAKASSLGGKKL